MIWFAVFFFLGGGGSFAACNTVSFMQIGWMNLTYSPQKKNINELLYQAR